MKEIADIIHGYGQSQKEGSRCALVTLVHVEGSSYRRAGARMLVTDNGVMTGGISGGCLEGDALIKAMLAIHCQRPMIVTYDTTDDEDAQLGLGLGCQGVIQVLFEPVDQHDPMNPVELLKHACSDRENCVLVTLFSLRNRQGIQPGTCMLIKNEKIYSRMSKDRLFESLLKDARMAAGRKASLFNNYAIAGASLNAFLEYISPPVSLVVAGAGNDVPPLVNMAGILGWKTTVIDGRAALARKDRFIPACRVLLSRPEDALKNIVLDQRTVVLLMTHNYYYDLAILRAVIQQDVAYIGSLGPRKKLDRMLEELQSAGQLPPPDRLRHIYGPVGLDIGAETPEEIALSILAEIKTVMADKKGRSLRNKKGVIHDRSGFGDPTSITVSQIPTTEIGQ